MRSIKGIKHMRRSTNKFSFEVKEIEIVSGVPSNLSATGLVVQMSRGPKLTTTKEVELTQDAKEQGGGIVFPSKLNFVATLFASKTGKTTGFSDKRYRISVLALKPTFGTSKKQLKEIAAAELNISEYAGKEGESALSLQLDRKAHDGLPLTLTATIVARGVKPGQDDDDDDDDSMSVASGVPGFDAGRQVPSEAPSDPAHLEQDLQGFDLLQSQRDNLFKRTPRSPASSSAAGDGEEPPSPTITTQPVAPIRLATQELFGAKSAELNNKSRRNLQISTPTAASSAEKEQAEIEAEFGEQPAMTPTSPPHHGRNPFALKLPSSAAGSQSAASAAAAAAFADDDDEVDADDDDDDDESEEGLTLSPGDDEEDDGFVGSGAVGAVEAGPPPQPVKVDTPPNDVPRKARLVLGMEGEKAAAGAAPAASAPPPQQQMPGETASSLSSAGASSSSSSGSGSEQVVVQQQQQQELAKLRDELASTREQLQRVGEEGKTSAKKVDELKARLAEAEKGWSNSQRERQTIKATLAAAESERDALQEQLAAADAAKIAAAASASGEQGGADAQQQSAAAAADEVAALRSDLSKAKRQAALSDANCASAESDIAHLKKKLAAASAEAEEAVSAAKKKADDEIGEVTMMLIEAKMASAQHAHERDEMKVKAKEMRSELERVLGGGKKVAEKATKMEVKYEMLREKYDADLNELAELRAKVAELSGPSVS